MTLTSIVGELILGWLLADFLTGAFHWWEDNFGDEDWPIVGRWIIAPNRLHHVDPLAFTNHGFVDRNGAQIIAAGLVGMVAAWLFGASFFLGALVIGGALVNEVHRYSHRPALAPAWMQALQRTGLLQSPKEHALHHRPPFERNYCVLTDWLNPILDALGVWTRIERLVGRRA